MTTPDIITRLAASVGGIVLAWREYDDHFTVVMMDGRKMTFRKNDPSQPRNTMQPTDMHDRRSADRVGEDAAAPRRASKTRRTQ
jgi:hypothetical protein